MQKNKINIKIIVIRFFTLYIINVKLFQNNDIEVIINKLENTIINNINKPNSILLLVKFIYNSINYYILFI